MSVGPQDERILVLPPTRQDGELTRDILSGAGISCELFTDLASLCRELDTRGGGAALITEEAVSSRQIDCLAALLGRQPAWSEIPILILTYGGMDSPGGERALDLLRGAILIDRPVRVATLISVVRAAIASRRRQYEIREHLAERAEREGELRRAGDELREADHAKDDFLAMLAHELRNPLSPITAAAHILGMACPDDPLVARQRETIARQTRHLKRLLDDLLDVSRITRGKVALERGRLDLRSVVAQAVEAAQPLIAEKCHDLTLYLPSDEVLLEGDEVRLCEVVTNLLTNAAKYTEPGGRISITLRCDESEAILSVRDTGQGIDPDLLPRMFDLFRQGARSLGREQGGLGIGLTLVRRLTEMHGGTVEARSGGAGQGSEFLVRLPLPAAPLSLEEPPTRHGTAMPQPAPSRRVLIVDDNLDALETTAELVSLWGHTVTTAQSGAEALTAAAGFRPDIVLLDLGMPGMDGFEVARRVKQIEAVKDARLVALTGYGREEDRRQTREAGFADHLTKPLDPQELERLLATGADGAARG